VPTDTVYGLAVSPLRSDAVTRLYELKGRPTRQHLPIMVASRNDLVPLGVEINTNVEKLLRSKYVPGPLTIAMGFNNRPQVAWLAGRVEVAIRIPNDTRMLEVLRRTGPLLVTSANKHGCKPGETVQDILAQLAGAPDVSIDGGVLHIVPSTLVNCRLIPPVVERVGCVSAEAIMALIN
jgi:L-threonylcarbamoyladenylate synthase